MWTLNGAMHALDRALDSPAATALALLALLAVPLAATTGIGRTARAEARPLAAASAAVAASGYQLRCWQQGRLLFERELAAPPLDATGFALKARGDDRSGRPVLVAETANATCLVQHRAD